MRQPQPGARLCIFSTPAGRRVRCSPFCQGYLEKTRMCAFVKGVITVTRLERGLAVVADHFGIDRKLLQAVMDGQPFPTEEAEETTEDGA